MGLLPLGLRPRGTAGSAWNGLERAGSPPVGCFTRTSLRSCFKAELGVAAAGFCGPSLCPCLGCREEASKHKWARLDCRPGPQTGSLRETRTPREPPAGAGAPGCSAEPLAEVLKPRDSQDRRSEVVRRLPAAALDSAPRIPLWGGTPSLVGGL